ncbi:MAG: hypothetical protein KAW09_02380, partial [Thermoplasmata archaeon]|nr:hypothetical protein [Thermoplasmata archaeon]
FSIRPRVFSQSRTGVFEMDAEEEQSAREGRGLEHEIIEEEPKRISLWSKLGAIVISGILIAAGFGYLLVKMDELERKVSELEETTESMEDYSTEVEELGLTVFILENDLANLTKDLEYLNSTVSGLSDLSEDIEDLQNEMSEVQSQLLVLRNDIENNSANISAIQSNITMLISSINSLTTSLEELSNRVDFLEHHVVRITVERFYPKVNDCVVGNTCDAVWVTAVVNNTSYSYNVGNLARDSQFDSVWLNWSFNHPNNELSRFLDIDFRITYAFGVFDIDGTSDSTVVSIVYDVVNETWSGEDDDGHTDGSLDGIGGEFDTEFWYSVETL